MFLKKEKTLHGEWKKRVEKNQCQAVTELITETLLWKSFTWFCHLNTRVMSSEVYHLKNGKIKKTVKKTNIYCTLEARKCERFERCSAKSWEKIDYLYVSKVQWKVKLYKSREAALKISFSLSTITMPTILIEYYKGSKVFSAQMRSTALVPRTFLWFMLLF